MNTLQIKQIKGYFNKEYMNLIDIEDVPEGQKDTTFLSRALALYSLKTLTDVDLESLKDSITDGFDDNGIDAIFYQKEEHTLWLIQSKFKDNGQGAIEQGEILKFTNGIKDLLAFEDRKERFNEKIRSKEIEILDALEDFNIKFKCVLAYSSNDLSIHIQNVVDNLKNELNKDGDYIEFLYFDLKKIHSSIKTEGNPINLDIDFISWGKIEEPYTAFYGQVYASDIAAWYNNYAEKLSSKNIRGFKGETTINEKIINTLLTSPEHFFYFNNGITILCKNITYKRIPPNREHNGFCCEDVSVINGAQTVGCIATAYNKNPEKINDVKVLVRLISLNNMPDELGDLITNATNTQNKVSNKDFASRDKIQINLQKELYLDGINYYIKNYEGIQKDEKSFDIEDAAIALSCASDDIALVNIAKGQVGKLYEDITKKPYIVLFNEKTHYYKIKNLVKVLFLVDDVILPFKARKNKELDSRARGFYVHGNRFLLHLVYCIIPKEILYSSDFTKLENFVTKQEFKNKIVEIGNIAILKQEELFPGSALHQLYKNREKCNLLKQEIFNAYNQNNSENTSVTH